MLNRGPKIVHVADEEVQVFPESPQSDMGCNRELLEFLSCQFGKTENVVVAIFSGFAAGSRAIGDNGDWLAYSFDAADEEIDFLL